MGPRACDIFATVTNADGKSITIETPWIESGTRSQALATIKRGTWEQLARPRVLAIAADAGFSADDGARIDWDARAVRP